MCRIVLVLCFVFIGHLSAYELGVISMFRNCAPYLQEWIEYHHMVGVDHFWLYNDNSSDDYAAVLKPYVESGLVEVFYWPAEKPYWVRSQVAAFKNGLTKAKESHTKWVALLDQDEFVMPMREKTIPECLAAHYTEASAVYANWRHFGTSHVVLAPGEPMLTRLTSCSLRTHPKNVIGKSIVRPECVNIDQVYYVHHYPLLPGAVYMDGDGGKTMVARKNDWLPDTKVHDKYLRINHYMYRDESYFHNVRVPRDKSRHFNLDDTYAQYEAFNTIKDHFIVNFIKNEHPQMWQKFWAPK